MRGTEKRNRWPGAIRVSVPSSSGQCAELVVECKQSMIGEFQSPLLRGNARNSGLCLDRWQTSSFSPLFFGAMRGTTTLDAFDAENYCFSPLFFGAMRGTLSFYFNRRIITW